MLSSVILSWSIASLQLLSLFVSIATCDKTGKNAQSSVVVPPLVLQDINFIIVTDVHSWVAGHIHNETLDANYGDVVSFYELLQKRSVEERKDLFFFMNGDFVDGTGFSIDAPTYLTPILKKIPWDALNIGNHELLHNSTIEYITQPHGFVDFWDGRYLTSNVILMKSGEPIGSRYRFLEGQFSMKTILVFGFLYDFQNHCEMVEVEDIESVVQMKWFQSVLKGNVRKFNAIVVLAHMDAFDPLIYIILNKIREICGDEMPVQFITGQSHQRKYTKLDEFSTTYEAGRYLDTIGFTSLSFFNNSVLFDHDFIDGNVNALKDSLGIQISDKLETPNGKELTDLIGSTADLLGLSRELGCSPMTYYMNNGLEKADSLWGLFSKTIIPRQLFNGSDSKLFIQNSGAFRYNLFEGTVTVNDLITVSPFNDALYKVGSGINGTDFIEAFGEPNFVDGTAYNAKLPQLELPQLIVSGNVIPHKEYEVYTIDFDVAYMKEKLENASGSVLKPTKMDKSTLYTLWEGYIEKEWSCPDFEENEEKKPMQQKLIGFFKSYTGIKVIALVMTFLATLVIGWMCCRVADAESEWEEADGSIFSVSTKTTTSGFGGMIAS